MSIHTRIIGNAFRLADMTPGIEAAIGREMLAAVGRERKRPETPQSGYRQPKFDCADSVAARATVLRLLAEGPMYSLDMLGSVAMARQQFMGLLGAMRREGAIIGDRPDHGKPAIWRLP
jgi:hypothetical protein